MEEEEEEEEEKCRMDVFLCLWWWERWSDSCQGFLNQSVCDVVDIINMWKQLQTGSRTHIYTYIQNRFRDPV
jgi:hypothetical protein